MSDKKSFILYQDYEDQVNLLSNEDAGILFKAILEHVNGKQIALSGTVGMVFALIKETIDRDKKKYQARLERKKNNGLNAKEATTSSAVLQTMGVGK